MNIENIDKANELVKYLDELQARLADVKRAKACGFHYDIRCFSMNPETFRFSFPEEFHKEFYGAYIKSLESKIDEVMKEIEVL